MRVVFRTLHRNLHASIQQLLTALGHGTGDPATVDLRHREPCRALPVFIEIVIIPRLSLQQPVQVFARHRQQLLTAIPQFNFAFSFLSLFATCHDLILLQADDTNNNLESMGLNLQYRFAISPRLLAGTIGTVPQ